MNRTLVVLVLIILMITPGTLAHAQPTPTADWPLTAPEEQGIDSAKLGQALLVISESGMPIHSLLIVRDGKLVLDAHFYPYDGSTPHDLASVTKSVTTTLLGIAVDQQLLTLDDPVMSFFPERTVANRDDRKERITVGNLASMTGGFQCVAEPFELTLQEMESSPDYVQFALDLPMAEEPGSIYNYCSPGMHLLSAILSKATGMTELDFARQYLFGPLGITDVVWPADPQGITHGWGDLYLQPRDAAKIGQLWLNQGSWNGAQIVPADWVEDASAVHAQMPLDEGADYGYGWWIERDSGIGGHVSARGRAGQRISIFPAINSVIVTTAAGVDPDDAIDMLTPALIDPEHPLPENPAGMMELEDALRTIMQPPDPIPVPPLPAIADVISGKTFCVSPNPLGLATVQLTFDPSGVGELRLTFSNSEPDRSGVIGLDGVYRLSPGQHGYPAGMRGRWVDETTFVLQYEEIANIEAFRLESRYATDGRSLEISATSRTEDASVELVAAVCE